MSTPALRQAAEDLVQVAICESSQGATLDELKHIHSLNQQLLDANGGISEKLGELNTTLLNSNKEVNTTLSTLVNSNAEVVTELKANRRLLEVGSLQWAITNASAGAFNYIQGTEQNRYSPPASSEALVKKILLLFTRGNGMYLPVGDKIRDENAWSVHQHNVERGKVPEADKGKFELSEVASFHTALIGQIYSLTGQGPRVEKKDDGRYVIYRK